MYGQRIKEIRIENNLTQKELGKLLNVDQRTISQYENGNREINLNTLVKLCKKFNVTADYILEIDKEIDKTKIEQEEIEIKNLTYKRSRKYENN